MSSVEPKFVHPLTRDSINYHYVTFFVKFRTSSMGWEYHWDSVAPPPWVLDDILKIIKTIHIDKKYNYSNGFFKFEKWNLL